MKKIIQFNNDKTHTRNQLLQALDIAYIYLSALPYGFDYREAEKGIISACQIINPEIPESSAQFALEVIMENYKESALNNSYLLMRDELKETFSIKGEMERGNPFLDD